ncbi:MAG: hypothetical protein AAFX79_10465 [Planctomycetota bacterium]
MPQAGRPRPRWNSPTVRTARLGGLCVVSAIGLIGAGAIAAASPTRPALLLAAGLLALPALGLAALAADRWLRTRLG